jgi:co-chaperonin GroES (HSP10)
MKIRPLGDPVLRQESKEEEGLVVIPDTAKEAAGGR